MLYWLRMSCALRIIVNVFVRLLNLLKTRMPILRLNFTMFSSVGLKV